MSLNEITVTACGTEPVSHWMFSEHPCIISRGVSKPCEKWKKLAAYTLPSQLFHITHQGKLAVIAVGAWINV